MGNLAYQEEITTELINGRSIAMSPRPAVNHNIVALNIARIFGNFLKGKHCIAFSDGVDVYLTEKDRVIPDYLLEKMTEEEKGGIACEFKTSLYPDMTVVLEDVFENIL